MKTKNNKDINKIPKRKNDGSNSKKNVISKTNSVSDSDHSMDMEDNNYGLGEACLTLQIQKTVNHVQWMSLND